jgi:asparagine synthase (glutamine-hydrolysing)
MTGSTSRDSRPSSGVLGWKGLGQNETMDLLRWAHNRGGHAEAQEEPFYLWRFGTPHGGLSSFCAGAGRTWLIGDVFLDDDQKATASTTLLPSARSADPHHTLRLLTGNFASVTWDPRRREILFLRDGSCCYSFYYHSTSNEGLIFSDRLDLLLACPRVPRRLSPDGLNEYLRFLDVSTPNTIYDSVYSIEPDEIYVLGCAGLQAIPRPSRGRRKPDLRDLDEAATILDAKLAAAVRTSTVSADSVVAFLSGGVDSSYLCALAASQSPQNIDALTVGFEDLAADESVIAGAVARHLGVRHHVLRIPVRSYRSAFDELAERADYPFADPAGPPTLLAFRRARELADLALDGTGADTLLGLMPARHQRIAVEFAALLPYQVRVRLAAAAGRMSIIRDYRTLLDFGDPPEILVRWQGWTRREIEYLRDRPVNLSSTRFYRVFGSFKRNEHYERYSALMGSLPDDRIHVAAALTGVRVRFPFFFPDVEACVRRIDYPLRYRHGEHKRVLKHGLARRLPRSLWDAPKHGFDFPFADLLAIDDYSLVRAYVRAENIRRLGIERPDALKTLTDNFIAGDRRHRFRVWGLTVLTAWLEKHDLAA